jgi:ectoine hydroxylase-related dioxygenase (phytanoyl-CoA dioxygenase family)
VKGEYVMHLSYRDVERFERDGYLLVDELFTAAEVEKMLQAIAGGDRVARTTRAVGDGEGKKAKLAIWHELGEDIWSAVSTCPRIVNHVRILLKEEASFFHGKVMLKEAMSGGAWEWHQDYGYWYNQGFLFPHLISAFVALDPATQENGCLMVLKGSHKLGRLDHGRVGDQTGADPQRIGQIEDQFELVHCEMKPGSVLFFHSNLLHSSQANLSEKDRRSFIICYSAMDNPQVVEGKVVYRESCPVGSDNWG